MMEKPNNSDWESSSNVVLSLGRSFSSSKIDTWSERLYGHEESVGVAKHGVICNELRGKGVER